MMPPAHIEAAIAALSDLDIDLNPVSVKAKSHRDEHD